MKLNCLLLYILMMLAAFLAGTIGYAYGYSVNERAHALESLDFIENMGQWSAEARFKVEVPEGSFFLTDGGFVYHYVSSADLARLHEAGQESDADLSEAMVRHHAYKVSFVNAHSDVRYEVADQRPYHHNYFLGNDPSIWQGGVALYGAVRQRGVYPGIDVSMYSRGRALKYDFIVAPGADPKQILLAFQGVQPVLTSEGHLKIVTSVNEVIEEAPYVYQEIDGEVVAVRCHYRLEGEMLSFDLPDGYDIRYPLVIDPAVVFSTYSGSIGGEKYAYASVYDQAGNFYLGAHARSTGWPATTGAFQTAYTGSFDVGINKYDPAGSALIYATYFGGSNDDVPHALVVNDQQELIVVGTTASSNLPMPSHAYDRTLGGTRDLFVARFNAAGSVLIGATYVGGSAAEGIYQTIGATNPSFEGGVFWVSPCDVMLNDTGDIWVVSNTASTNFPVTAGAQQPTYGGGSADAVLFRLKADCSALQYSTFLGGSRKDDGYSIAFNPQQQIVICGGTNSPNYPVSFSAYQRNPMGSADGFVSVVDPVTGLITYSTYLGTDTLDIAFKVAVNGQGEIYVAGRTMGNYPITPGAFSMGTDKDVFLEKLTPDLSASIVRTRFGNRQSLNTRFVPTAFMVDHCNNIYLAGFRWTTGIADYPLTSNAFQSVSGGFWMGVMDRDYSGILFGTFYGTGTAYHIHQGTHRLDPNGVVYHSICADNANFPVTPGSFRSAKTNTGQDAVSFKFDLSEYVQKDTLHSRLDTVVCIGQSLVLTAGEPGIATVDHLWQDGSNAKSFRANAPGIYTVQYRHRDRICTTYHSTFYVAFAALPEVYAIDVDSAGCPGEMKGVVNVRMQAGLTQHRFQLSSTTDTSVSYLATAQDGYRFTGLGADTYRILISTASGCDTSWLLSVPGSLAPSASFLLSDTVICAGDYVVCTNTSSGSYDAWHWTPGNGEASSMIYKPQFYYPNAGRYILTLHVANDLCADTATRELEVRGLPLRLHTSGDIVPYGTEVHLWTEAGQPYIIYRWSAEHMFPDQQAYEQRVVLDSHSINRITVYGRSEFGCHDSASLVVIVDGGLPPTEGSGAQVMTPTAFSPNGDGRNDHFRPVVLSGNARVVFFEVYDRWGRQVWTTHAGAAAKRGWDGTYQGVPAQIGVYYYVIEMEDVRGSRTQYRGDVMLVR